jgi:hypothetical protein
MISLQRPQSIDDLFEFTLLNSNKVKRIMNNNIKNSPERIMRQYRDIFTSNYFEGVEFLRKRSNYCELSVKGTEYSKWWFFRSNKNNIWIVSCSIDTYDSIIYGDNTKYSKFEFTEVSFEETKNIIFKSITEK